MTSTPPGRFSDRAALAILVVLAVAGCLLPRCVSDMESSYLVSVLFQSFLYLALAQGWNLVAGYAGQMSLGLHAFFGTGAYVTALIWNRGFGGYFDPVTMLLSGLFAALLAVLVGIPLLSRLRGDYFALGTLGLGEILRVVVIQGGAVTGGSSGLILPAANYTSIGRYYYSGLTLAALSALTVYLLAKSRIGLALIAIRDSETAASAAGIDTLRYKVGAFALCAFLAGLCGSLQAYYLFQVSPSSFFNLNWSLIPIMICVLGGVGTVIGPVAGTFVLVVLLEVSKKWLPAVHTILSGVLIIVVVLFLPGGLLSLAKPAGTRERRVAEGK